MLVLGPELRPLLLSPIYSSWESLLSTTTAAYFFSSVEAEGKKEDMKPKGKH